MIAFVSCVCLGVCVLWEKRAFCVWFMRGFSFDIKGFLILKGEEKEPDYIHMKACFLRLLLPMIYFAWSVNAKQKKVLNFLLLVNTFQTARYRPDGINQSQVLLELDFNTSYWKLDLYPLKQKHLTAQKFNHFGRYSYLRSINTVVGLIVFLT